MISRRLLLGSGAVTAMAAGAVGQALAAEAKGPPTVKEIFLDPTSIDAAISPDGKTVAVLRQAVERTPENIGRDKYKYQKRDSYDASIDLRATADVDTVRTIKIGALKPEKIAWANNELLLIWVIWRTRFADIARRLAVLSRDGKTLRYLLDEKKVKSLPYQDQDQGDVVDLMPDDPNYIMVNLSDQAGSALYKVHLYNDTVELVEKGAMLAVEWFVQDGVPVVRRDIMPNEKVIRVMGRPKGAKDWKVLAEQPVILGVTHDFEILGVAKEAGVIRVAAYAQGADAKNIYNFDMTRNAWGQRLNRRSADVYDVITDDRGDFMGVSYLDDRHSFESTDTALEKDLKVLTDAFPMASLTILSMTQDHNHMVVLASGPLQPGQFVYFNRQAGGIAILGTMQPWLSEDRLAPTQAVSVMSTGGQAVRAYLTGHAGRNKPMVVMPHGGPEARDQISFDAFAQVFAAQGWLVLQPNFRGSSGYGKAFADAGRGQWNGAAMEDIEACIDATVKAGLADPKRIAIFGWSFGGYAALMCGIRRPDAYRAVVSVAGVADLKGMMKYQRTAGVDSASYKYWLKTIGDPNVEAEKLRLGSPGERGSEMKAPVLLIHGEFDGVVPIDQSESMARSLRMNNKTYEFHKMPMAHSPRDRDHYVEVFERVVDFLKPKLA